MDSFVFTGILCAIEVWTKYVCYINKCVNV